MTKESSDVPKSVRLVPMDRVVILGKGLLEEIGPQSVQFGEPFANQTIELGIGPLL